MVEVKFEIEKDDTLKTEKWVCPVTGKELGVNVRAVYLVPCGHAVSYQSQLTDERVLSQYPSIIPI